MTKAAKTASARPAPAASATTAPNDAPLKLQAFAAPTRRANWELRALGAPGFELASALPAKVGPVWR